VEETPPDNPVSPNRPSSASSSFLEGVRVRDPKAWQRMVDLHGPVVYSWARRAGLQPMAAGKVVQDAFRTVSIRVEEFRGEGEHENFRTWVWTISRNRIENYLQEQADHQSQAAGLEATEVETAVDSVELDITTPQPPPPDAALLHRVLGAIRPDFEDLTWDAFWNMAVLGRSSSEVAEAMGTTKGIARDSKYAVLRRLRQELEQA
jgi:RNA polymerase sigma-70 factor (ECF subfamily)